MGLFGGGGVYFIFKVFLSYTLNFYLFFTSLLQNLYYHRKINAKESWLQATQEKYDIPKFCAVH